jgi:aminoglycoside 2''-phosphotransferase
MGLLKSFTAALLPHATLGKALSAKSFFRARAALPAYLEQIRDAFPDLQFQDARLIDNGLENVVVILDREWVFRFPRSEWSFHSFALEQRLLTELRARTAIELPNYRHVAPDMRFGGYPIVKGEPLGNSLFQSLDHAGQCQALDQFADFLNALHGLSPPRLYGKQPRHGTPKADFIALYFQQQRKYLAPKLGQGLLGRIDEFFNVYAAAETYPERVCHGDIDDHHVLFNLSSQKLGIIDFGDAGIGDPAMDFAFLFTLPSWAASYVFDRYVFLAEDPHLPERALRHSVRFAVSRMWNCLQHEGYPRIFADTASALKMQLTLLEA